MVRIRLDCKYAFLGRKIETPLIEFRDNRYFYLIRFFYIWFQCWEERDLISWFLLFLSWFEQNILKKKWTEVPFRILFEQKTLDRCQKWSFENPSGYHKYVKLKLEARSSMMYRTVMFTTSLEYSSLKISAQTHHAKRKRPKYRDGCECEMKKTTTPRTKPTLTHTLVIRNLIMYIISVKYQRKKTSVWVYSSAPIWICRVYKNCGIIF
jgi:hypothetical protein